MLDNGKPIALVLAGGGVAPNVFAPALQGTWLDDWQVVFVDYLCGEGPFDVLGIATQLSRELEHFSGPVVLLGHSLGGAVSLVIAGQSGKRVSGVIVSDTGLDTSGHGDPGLPDRIRSDWSVDRRSEFVSTWTRDAVEPVLYELLMAYLSEIDRMVFAENVESLRKVSVDEFARNVSAPVAVFHGLSDERRSISDARSIADTVGTSLLFVFDCGHTPFVERPAEVRAVINGLSSVERWMQALRGPVVCAGLRADV